jgi:hypothetical protein
MPKIAASKATRSFAELARFVSRQDVIDALEKAGKDRSLYRKAKADPKAYFRGHGIKVPPRADLTISRRPAALSGQLTICLRVCFGFGRVMICVDICITIVFG